MFASHGSIVRVMFVLLMVQSPVLTPAAAITMGEKNEDGVILARRAARLGRTAPAGQAGRHAAVFITFWAPSVRVPPSFSPPAPALLCCVCRGEIRGRTSRG